MDSPGPDVVEPGVLGGRDVAPRVMRGGIQRTAGFVAVNLITVAGAVILLRYLGVEDFGRYGTVMALLAIVQGVSDAGLSMTGSRELAVRDSEQERRELLAHLLGLRIVLSAAGVAAAILFALAAGYDALLVEGTVLAGAGVLIISVQAAMLLPLVVELRNGRLALNEVLRQLALVVGFVVLVVVGASLLAFFAMQLVAALVLLLITPLLLHRRRLVAPRWQREQLVSLARTTLPLAVSAVLSVLYFRILVVLMSVLEPSAREVGYYVTSTRVVETLLGLPVTLVGIVLPVLSVAARDDAGRLRYVTLRLTQVLAFLGILSALFLGVGAEPVITILGGEQYAGAAPVLQIQCVALITIFTAAAWTTTLVSMGRARALAIGTAIGVAAVTLFGVALIPPLGAQGAALAAVAGDLILSVVFFEMLRRAGPAGGLADRAFVKLALATVPPLLFAIASPLPALLEAVIVAIAFPVCALLLGALPEEVHDRVVGVLRRRRR